MNIFLCKEIKEEIFSIFSFIQKSYFAFIRLKILLLFKNSKKIVENDLSLNPIFEKDKNILVIFQNNNKYLFHIRDLLHLINNCLGHSSNFFSKPIIIKNPYNNVIFSKSTLYNIYFFMKFKTMYFSELLHKFFLSNFDLTDFYDKNSYLLRNYAIEDYFKNTTSENLIIEMEDMLNEFNKKFKLNKIEIDPDFPNKKYIEVFKPYLKLYIITKYSFLYIDKVNAKKKLDKKLLNFQFFNPNFGRKMVKINLLNKKIGKLSENKKEKGDQTKLESIFMEEHISFYQNKNIKTDFLNNHIILNENSEVDE